MAGNRMGWTDDWSDWSWGVALSLACAGVMVGLAAEFHWLGWSFMPGNSCGGNYRPCPEGTTSTLLLAFLFTMTGLPFAGKLFTDFDSPRDWLVAGTLLVSCAVLALWPGWRAVSWLRGPVAEIAWTVPPDRPASTRVEGTWALDDSLVRVRTDALIAYGARDGGQRWRVAAPVRKSVCAMSATPSKGVGVVGFHPHDGPCDTLRAIDLRTGRTLWERSLTGGEKLTSASPGLLTVEGEVATALVDNRLTAFGLRDGRPRWTAPLGETCAPVLSSSAGGRTRVVVTCVSPDDLDTITTELLTFNTATGARETRQQLPVGSALTRAVVVSAAPFALWLQEEDERGMNAVMSFGGRGGDSVVIPLSTDDEDLVPDLGYPAFRAQPLPLTATSGDVLVMASQKPGDDTAQALSAFSLRDGQRLWHRGLGADVNSLAPLGSNRIAALTDRLDHLWTLDARTGHPREDDGVYLRADVREPIGSRPQLVPVRGDRWFIINEDGDANPPVLGLHR